MRSLVRQLPIAILTAVLAEGCASSSNAPRLPVTPIGVREAQTRFFEGVSPTTAMKAAIDMLQDGGFTIDQTDAALGLIVGKRQKIHRASDGETVLKWTTIAFTYGLSSFLPWTKNESNEIEASVNVTAVDDGVRIRISLERRTLDRKGRPQKAETLTEGLVYKDLFELLDRSLFVGQGQ